MDHNPKKSRALIITIIAILILLIAGYFIFKGSGTLFGIKSGSTTNSKTFDPLLGTSKQKTTVDTNVVNNSSQNVPSTNLSVPDKNIAPGSASTPVGQNPSAGKPKAIAPALNPLPAPTTDCTDKNGNLIPCANANGVISTTTNTSVPAPLPPTPAPATNPSICPADDPLVFTDNEQTQLADLLRQYYIIAASLKTEDDLSILEGDTLTNKSLVAQVNSLTKDCKDQKADPRYTGPQTIKNNPYYSDPNNTTLSYIPDQPSTWITTSEYYQPGYGRPVTTIIPPTIGGGLLGIFGAGGGGVTIEWPDAYYGPKITSYKDFEQKLNIW